MELDLLFPMLHKVSHDDIYDRSTIIKAGYTYSMDYDRLSCRGDQVSVLGGTNPSFDLESYSWKPLGDIEVRIDGWNVIHNLPDTPPRLL